MNYVKEERAAAFFGEESTKNYSENPHVFGVNPEENGSDHLVRYSLMTQIGIQSGIDLVLNNKFRISTAQMSDGEPRNIYFKVDPDELYRPEQLHEKGLEGIKVTGLGSMDARTEI